VIITKLLKSRSCSFVSYTEAIWQKPVSRFKGQPAQNHEGK